MCLPWITEVFSCVCFVSSCVDAKAFYTRAISIQLCYKGTDWLIQNSCQISSSGLKEVLPSDWLISLCTLPACVHVLYFPPKISCDIQLVSRVHNRIIMEEFSDINFLAVVEGQDYERSLRKIVSIIVVSSLLYWVH